MLKQLFSDRGSRGAVSTMLCTGLCVTACSILTAMLTEHWGLSYVWSGIFLSCVSVGQLTASLLTGPLSTWWHLKGTAAVFSIGGVLGAVLLALTGEPLLLAVGFALIGAAKGCTLNVASVLISGAPLPKTKGMNLIHAFYACGALLCPVVITFSGSLGGWTGPFWCLALVGALLSLSFALCRLPGRSAEKKSAVSEWSFLKSPAFWLLAALLFLETSAEGGVTGWLVSYYRGAGILTGEASSWTVTVVWGTMLVARLIITFALPPMDHRKMMVVISVCCIAAYTGLMLCTGPVSSLLMLAVFGLCVAGANPTVVAGAGEMLTPQSMSVLLPIGALGSILMPSVVGVIADGWSLQAGMGSILVPMTGMLVLSLLQARQGKASKL